MSPKFLRGKQYLKVIMAAGNIRLSKAEKRLITYILKNVPEVPIKHFGHGLHRLHGFEGLFPIPGEIENVITRYAEVVRLSSYVSETFAQPWKNVIRMTPGLWRLM
jgi:hypothetical protein